MSVGYPVRALVGWSRATWWRSEAERSCARRGGVGEDEISSGGVLTGHGSARRMCLLRRRRCWWVIVMADELRRDADRIVERLRAEGTSMSRCCRATAGQWVNGRPRARSRPRLRRAPEEKLEVVRRLSDAQGTPGDHGRRWGNDAPALASPTSASRWAWPARPSSETADAVITVDRIDRVADAVRTGRRHSTSRSRACSPGWDSASPPWPSLPPDTCRRSQARSPRAIDLAVILNALRALRG